MQDDTYNELGVAERITQNKVVALFRDHLQFTYLGNWKAGKCPYVTHRRRLATLLAGMARK